MTCATAHTYLASECQNSFRFMDKGFSQSTVKKCCEQDKQCSQPLKSICLAQRVCEVSFLGLPDAVTEEKIQPTNRARARDFLLVLGYPVPSYYFDAPVADGNE